MMDELIIAAKYAIKTVELFSKLECDEITRQGMIYSLICELKMKLPEDFEQALIVFLKHGVAKYEKD